MVCSLLAVKQDSFPNTRRRLLSAEEGIIVSAGCVIYHVQFYIKYIALVLHCSNFDHVVNVDFFYK